MKDLPVALAAVALIGLSLIVPARAVEIRGVYAGVASVFPLCSGLWHPFALRGLATGTIITGEARIIDGDGVAVAGHAIRLAGIDAPELDQLAKHRDGYWFNHGQHVKRALNREIGGKEVRIRVDGYDKYDRVLGIVVHDGRDINEWLVREGHAIAAYSDHYKAVETEARNAQRGMWGHAVVWDPRVWRHRKNSRRLEPL